MILSRKFLGSLSRATQANPAVLCIRSQGSTAAQPQQSDDAKAKAAKNKAPKPSKSFVMNMFCGRSMTEQLIPFPFALTQEQTDTITMLVDPTERFFVECNDPVANDQLETVQEHSMQGLKDMGAFGIQVPTEYGGLGLNNSQYARMTEIVGANDLAVGITLGAHQSIGFKGILLFGTPEQKAKYLPKVASGEHLAAFCLTEPTNGSDAATIKTKAVLSDDGKHFILNGGKIWISNGGLAEVFTVFAQTPVKDEKTGATRDRMVALIVERSFGGVTNGPPEKKMGIKASNTAEVYFDNVHVPVENLLGNIGDGFKIAMEILNNGRFGMASALAGTMRSLMGKSIEFAINREQFGNKICNYGAIQEKIARMAMLQYVTESLAYMITGNMDSGSQDYHLEAAISKVFGSEAAWWVGDEAIQVMGGMGFMKETGLERVMRDLRIFRIFEGANDILRLFVALTGLQYAGGHLRELQKALKNPAANIGMIFGEGSKRAKRAIGLTNGGALQGVHSNLGPQSAAVGQCVEQFGNACESLLIQHGKGIVEKQFQLMRVANAAIDLYTSAVVLSRATRALENNYATASHEEKLARVWVNEAVERAQLNLKVARSSSHNNNFKDMQSISQEVCEVGGPNTTRALGI